MISKNTKSSRLALGLSVALLGICASILSSCSAFEDKDSAPLPGERVSVLDLQKSLEPDDAVVNGINPAPPAEWRNDFWPQAGGYPNHSLQHLALSSGILKEVWSAKIGRGASKDFPLITQPVAIDGRIFTVDSEGLLSAFGMGTGKKLWERDINASGEDDQVIGGGLASSGGLLFATNGYNEVMALNPVNGNVVWRKSIPAPSRAAPTIIDDKVFVTTLDSRILALDAKSGSLLWEYTGIGGATSLVGAASPAANNSIVVPVFSSGEISALRTGNGSVAWSDNLSNVRGMGSLAEISDIRALPVIDRGLVFAISFSGRMAAIDERTGSRVWQREISGSQMPWLAGDQIFVLSSENQLVALGRQTGSIRWVSDLSLSNKDKKPMIFNGPVLAGGRLIVAGTDGQILEISPENGKILRKWDAGNTIVQPPIVVGAMLFLLTEDGMLLAYK